jgi:hypothetical protein
MYRAHSFIAAVACCMLEVLQHQHSPVAQQIWLQMSEQLSNCTNCINSYHQAQVCDQVSWFSTSQLLSPASAHGGKWFAVASSSLSSRVQPQGHAFAGCLLTPCVACAHSAADGPVW